MVYWTLHQRPTFYERKWKAVFAQRILLTARNTSTERNSRESLLLRLPAEIRNRIWTQVLAMEVIYVGDEFRDNSDYTTPALDLLRVCRPIYAEAALLPYSLNAFWFYSIPGLQSWLKQRAPVQKAVIQRIDIFCSDCEGCPLSLLPNLKTVCVSCICDMSHFYEPEEGLKIETQLREISGNPALVVPIIHG